MPSLKSVLESSAERCVTGEGSCCLESIGVFFLLSLLSFWSVRCDDRRVDRRTLLVDESRSLSAGEPWICGD